MIKGCYLNSQTIGKQGIKTEASPPLGLLLKASNGVTNASDDFAPDSRQLAAVGAMDALHRTLSAHAEISEV